MCKIAPAYPECGYLRRGRRDEQRAGFDGVRLRSRIRERTLPVERVREVVRGGLMLGIVAQLLRGRPENKRRRGKHQEQSKECGFAGGSGAYGSPKKKARLLKMSSLEGAMICDEREW